LFCCDKMWKFSVLFAVLFAFALSASSEKKPLVLNLPCAYHVHVIDSGNDHEEYLMLYAGKQVAYAREIFENRYARFYNMYYVNLSYTSKAPYYFQNESGTCVVDDNKYYGTQIEPIFEYSLGPTKIDCPTNTKSTYCLQYCNGHDCIAVDSQNRMVHKYSQGGSQVTYLHFNYYDDVSVETFSVDCQDNKYTAIDYCARPKELHLSGECYFHTVVKYGNITADSYWMRYEDTLAYVREDIVDSELEKNYSQIFYLVGDNPFYVTNASGSCNSSSIEADLFGYRHMGYYFTIFEYYNDPVQVACPPGGGYNCKQYCRNNFVNLKEECIIVDGQNRMIQYTGQGQLIRGDESWITATFEYDEEGGGKDDPRENTPDLDKFEVECNGATYKAFNTCEPWIVVMLNNSCMTHFEMSNSSGKYDGYMMYHGSSIAYLRIVDTKSKVFTNYYYDTTKDTATIVSNAGDHCWSHTVRKEDTPFIPPHFFHFSSTKVTCPDGKSTCTRYFNNATESYITTDSDEHVVEQYRDGSLSTYTYLSDIPGVDVFTVSCEGFDYSAKDYCNDDSSKTSSKTSSKAGSETSSKGSSTHGSTKSSGSGNDSSAGSATPHQSSHSQPVTGGGSGASVVEAAVAVVVTGLIVALL